MLNTLQRKSAVALSVLLALGTLGGCATNQASTDSKAAAPAAKTAAKAEAPAQKQTYFMVFHENGRIYAMTEPKIYLGLMEHDEVPLTRARVGGGPDGETVVFGITSKDGDHLDKPTAAEDIYDGRIKDVGAFYGEVVRNGRYHVFGEWKDFQDYLAHKEITFTYTEIGTGPKGETVIYALNNKTKDQGRPVALVEQFNALRK
ncbi:MAG: hypothetical protein BGP20_14820 [Thiobacillus sp. 63-78]|uniref:hypothetical protein n=1 Tax=Thiobacillus sp. 63-78 TaxID=1895859 RepID=UPI0008694BEE|nr:hypothetical protein [Thiobacillus sp. 63-78]MBN8761964.1 hypothetical protein [Thiobacillus sp.]ODU14312.1 MAG: hypothetical protein ABS91_00315 [Thiobacillus sp. SCN 64-35]OJZ08666.1 MAG: hypothetical protein BGP20_14820 [Thiobacillus sp. 63-78]